MAGGTTAEEPAGGVTPSGGAAGGIAEKPIEIAGEVIIADRIKAREEHSPEEAGNVFWVIDTTVNNVSYEFPPVKFNPFDWYLIIDDRTEIRAEHPTLLLYVDFSEFELTMGESGIGILLFNVPRTANEGNTKLAYKLFEDEYHFGDLTILEQRDFVYFTDSGRMVRGEPAQISGSVTAAAQLKSGVFTNKPKNPNYLFWIVDVTVKNEYFEDEIWSADNQWAIKADEVMYSADIFSDDDKWLKRTGGEQELWYPSSVLPMMPPEMSVSLGESGRTRLVFTVPSSLSISSATLGYRPALDYYIWGSLSGGSVVWTYEWPE